MDYERCAALHNELLTRAMKGRGRDMPASPRTWWEARAPSEEVAMTLHPSLREFLKRAWDEEVLPPHSKLFAFLGGSKMPDALRDRVGRLEEEGEEGRFIKLYESSHFRGGDDEGLLFDQTTLKATFIEDWNDTPYVTCQEWSWMPLEVIIDSYLQMIDEGKAQVVSGDQAKALKMDFLYGFMEPWILHQYTKTDLERATAAFKRLVDAIESRIPRSGGETATTSPKNLLPWQDPATFSNHDVLPPHSFAHAFLKSISDCKVGFRYIAPRIRFPTVAEFADQPVKDFITPSQNHLGQFPGNCPLRILQIDDAEQQYRQHLVSESRYDGLCDNTPGLYIDPVVQRWPLFWSNGCRLLLPFGIGAAGWARESNGQPLGLGDIDFLDEEPRGRAVRGDLYQAGMTNGITNSHLVQIDKVLNNWADRVESGDWAVDADGVAGDIEKFREADTEDHWRKYWIPLSW